MSRFDHALDLVLSQLRDRRRSGLDDWRASAASLDRLRAVRSKVSRLAGSGFGGAFAEVVVAPPAGRASKSLERSAVEQLTELCAMARARPCATCPYGSEPHEHFVFGVGNPAAALMFVGEAPGAEEDRLGEPFVGKAGQLLTKIINTMGFQREDIYIANILKCRPDMPENVAGNRKPTAAEMAGCRPTLYTQIAAIEPRVIVALGATAVAGLLDLDQPIGALRGRWHDFRGIPVMATYHPSYLLRNQAPSERRKVWEDMLLVKERLGQEITERDRNYFLTRP